MGGAAPLAGLVAASITALVTEVSASTNFSQQESETSSITVQGGAQTNEFNLTALDYESNRHFFIAQYFREDVMGADGKLSNRYNEALRTLPIITSNINITRIEVWVVNQTANVEETRNVIAFTDLGEDAEYAGIKAFKNA